MPPLKRPPNQHFTPDLDYSRDTIAEMINNCMDYGELEWDPIDKDHPQLTDDFCQEFVNALPVVPGEQSGDPFSRLYTDQSGKYFTEAWREKISIHFSPIYSVDSQQQELITLLLRGSGDIPGITSNRGKLTNSPRLVFNQLAALHKVIKITRDKIVRDKSSAYFNSQIEKAMEDWEINKEED